MTLGAEDDQRFAHGESGAKSTERNIVGNVPWRTIIASHSQERGKLLSHREFKRYLSAGGHIVLILI